MALQTREQHIKREKPHRIFARRRHCSPLCGMYAVYHGYEGLRDIARRIHLMAVTLSGELSDRGYAQVNTNFFDTLRILLPENVTTDSLKSLALEHRVNFRYFDDGTVGISLDETTNTGDLNRIIEVFSRLAGEPDLTVAATIRR